ncbi:hypothetical protein COV49_02805 [Candidatus Falkowbacteria bacterium CG11_big_fil_rev_8_21_14_0_20_39_10]|uniref:Uncharacterized protein n=1 Tax=Candidatus Falkowbacteria bacterium CG11_big_fil_rev_8_21_14_0_20_39_10 TaxID=1974570 RepID=A0A2M6K925_9BACT|nr:MAG: hypothetical protein COV49_02805 [Candidatus Falkowbacteria bacterium CG11_big_fil_rev_8_21_14_0_20_39_10]
MQKLIINNDNLDNVDDYYLDSLNYFHGFRFFMIFELVDFEVGERFVYKKHSNPLWLGYLAPMEQSPQSSIGS